VVGQNREKLESFPGFNLQQLGAAYVGDNSFFGIGSPVSGKRYRFGMEQYFGSIKMTSLTMDYRHYQFVRPFTFAFRGTHLGRYGDKVDEQNIFYPMYLGFPGFVRGADIRSLQKLDGQSIPVDDITVNNLLGSKAILAGFEIRFPLTGPRRFGLIANNFLFSEFVLFFDAGVVWRNNDKLTLDRNLIRQTFPLENESVGVGYYQYPFFSVGPAIRINLFGALILEPYLAFPFQKGGPTKGVWGLNFMPGW
jgi:outer membrane protein assembly factor BamA